jgi:aspartyl/asparaginyl beta-hydroxylase (cupin superfamily)
LATTSEAQLRSAALDAARRLAADGKLADAEQALARILEATPDFAVARLNLATVLERLGRRRDALLEYYRAIVAAQMKGLWLNEASTPPWLRDHVRYAMRFVETGRRELFRESIEPLRAKYGADELRRVDQALAFFVGDIPRQFADPRQRPKFLYFPDLAPRPYLDTARVPWLAELEKHTDDIRTEAQAMLASPEGLEPFLTFSRPEQEKLYLQSTQGKPAWDAFFFYRHGEHYADNARRCPGTTAVLESLPLARIRDHAPEICFSVLTPGTHILPHHGVTNTRLVSHLPLIVPPDCALRVGGEEHVWQEGRTVLFDDTFEHEAWNRGTRLRVVLILDLWHPELTEIERLAITDLVTSIGDFNRAGKADQPWM